MKACVYRKINKTGKSEGKRPLGRPGGKWKESIDVDLEWGVE
jgi:hypothetical protein